VKFKNEPGDWELPPEGPPNQKVYIGHGTWVGAVLLISAFVYGGLVFALLLKMCSG
jgi:hypothetical protein